MQLKKREKKEGKKRGQVIRSRPLIPIKVTKRKRKAKAKTKTKKQEYPHL